MLAASPIAPATAPTETADADFALLAAFLQQLSPAAKAIPLDENTPLLSSGILDSLSILHLMSFLGQELGIEIEDEDFTLDNFETIGSLLTFMRRRKG